MVDLFISGFKTALSRCLAFLTLLYSKRKRAWRILIGFSVLSSSMLALLVLTAIFYEFHRYILEEQTFQNFFEVLQLLSGASMVALVYAALIVYSIRILSWLRFHGPSIWNDEYPPRNESGEVRSLSPVQQPLDKCRRKLVEWFFIGIIVWSIFILSLFFVGTLLQEFGNLAGGVIGIDDLNKVDWSVATDTLTGVPVLGEIITLFNYFPGQSMVGRISYLMASLPLALSLRNALYLFENSHLSEDNGYISTNLKVYCLCFLTGLLYFVVIAAIVTFLVAVA